MTAKSYQEVVINTAGGFYAQFTSNPALRINPEVRKDNHEPIYKQNNGASIKIIPTGYLWY